MDFYYDPRTIFYLVEGGLRPSILSKLNIKFHFFFEIEYKNFYVNHDSTLQGFLQCFPSAKAYASAAVAVGESLSFEDIAAAVGRAIGDRIPAVRGRREDLIEFAWEQVLESFPAAETLPKYHVLHLTFNVRVEHRQVYVVEGECPFTIPAEEAPAFALLEKYEEEQESCCCICLEEVGGGGGALRTPCSHVFHGGCIKKWLTKNPCCPLCRYEMLME